MRAGRSVGDSNTGTVDCALFDAPIGFPIEVLRSATNVMVIKARHTQARCDSEDIPPGMYELAVIYNENMKGKLDTNSLGSPTEGYGFSNDAKGLLGPPSFAATSFAYDGRNLELTIPQGIVLNIIVGIVGALLAGLLLTPLFGIGTINQNNFSLPELLISEGRAS